MAVKDNSFGIADLQEKMLENLKEFISLCEQNILHYWLTDRSLLGVMCHEGFIPWNDELSKEVVMSV